MVYQSELRLLRYILTSLRFIPPKLNTEKTNIENSENTTLFLISCFQYILSGIVLSVGPPFRQPMTQNRTCPPHPQTHPPSTTNKMPVPFVVNIVAVILFTSYILFDPAIWLSNVMQLTKLPTDFKVFILVLATGGFLVAWIAERRVFGWCAVGFGKLHDRIWPARRKKRKEYKVLLEGMRM